MIAKDKVISVYEAKSYVVSCYEYFSSLQNKPVFNNLSEEEQRKFRAYIDDLYLASYASWTTNYY